MLLLFSLISARRPGEIYFMLIICALLFVSFLVVGLFFFLFFPLFFSFIPLSLTPFLALFYSLVLSLPLIFYIYMSLSLTHTHSYTHINFTINYFRTESFLTIITIFSSSLKCTASDEMSRLLKTSQRSPTP